MIALARAMRDTDDTAATLAAASSVDRLRYLEGLRAWHDMTALARIRASGKAGITAALCDATPAERSNILHACRPYASEADEAAEYLAMLGVPHLPPDGAGMVVQPAGEFDWKAPDYRPFYRERAEALAWIRANPDRIDALRDHYRGDIAQWLLDWAVCEDRRFAGIDDRADVCPVVLMPRQIEYADFLWERWLSGTPGTIVKSRDVGASILATAVGVALCTLNRKFSVGVASATEIKLDRSGDTDTLFAKLRLILSHLPAELRAGWSLDTCAYMRMTFPDTGSSVTGEAGSQAFRGTRKSIIFVDESAHFMHPQDLDRALANATRVRIDISTPAGIANSFYQRATNPAIARFDWSWRDDRRKDEAWYEQQCAELLPMDLAQEIDADFGASTERQIIPTTWIQAAVDFNKRAGITTVGKWCAAFDPAAKGTNRCAVAVAHGYEIKSVTTWSARADNMLDSMHRALDIAEGRGLTEIYYDADGLGNAVPGLMASANMTRGRVIREHMWRGSWTPVDPERRALGSTRKNIDAWKNIKAQAWFMLRYRFQQTALAVQGKPCDSEWLISLDSDGIGGELARLISELSQVQWDRDPSGRILVEKAPDGAMSPDAADSVMMVLAPKPYEHHGSK